MNGQTLSVIEEIGSHMPGGFFIYRAEPPEELIYANKAKTAFLSSVSHEIRTPMNAHLSKPVEPEHLYQTLDLTTITNSVGDEVHVESTAYEAYLQLKDALEKEGIHTELDSAYRSVEAQQKIVDEFTEKYGEDYVKEYVAVPGYSEHHTGLALDLYLIVDDKTVYENEDLVQYPEIWAKIHEKLPEYGFILRYPQDKDGVTGYSYEPWHIRYIGSPEIAKEITEKGITFEEYLNASK